MDIKALDKEIKALMLDMEREAFTLLRGNIDALGYQFEGSLQRSLNFTIRQENDQWVLDLKFTGHGTVLDSKRYFAYGAPVEQLTKYILSKGKGSFMYVPGYGDKSPSQWPDNWAYRIALGMQNTEQRYTSNAAGGIFKDKGKRTVSFQKRQWLYTPYFSLWKKKKDKLSERFLNVVHGDLLEDIKAVFDDQFRQALLGK